MKRSLFKYFSERRYAEAFLDGQILFRSLAYFRDCEDAARGDEYEGTSTFRPTEGLSGYNHTQRRAFTLPMAFESTVRADEIFAFCVSRAFSPELAREFGAVSCVEIIDIAALCARIEAALPSTATFHARAVEYYPETQAGSPRWALPGSIATAKLQRWAAQQEYRFVFSLTDALAFEHVRLQLIDRKHRPAPRPEAHRSHQLRTRRPLSDICVLHDVMAQPLRSWLPAPPRASRSRTATAKAR